MKAIDCPFTKVINGTTQFVIPVFQRDYSWTEIQCEQLWKDIVRVGKDTTERRHFLGSVVYVPSGDSTAGFTRWLLIDGQQRVTTLTLLLIALKRHLLETEWKSSSEDGPTPKRIEAYFLKNVQEEGRRQNKLVLRRYDQALLSALLNGDEIASDDNSRIDENYEFFRERVKEVDPEIVYRGISRLVVVDVALDGAQDDPQMIFESLNSTGVDLTQADLIRNFILMRLPEQKQTELYETYWRKIEALFQDAGKVFDSFARDYMALKSRASKQTRASEIYHEFRGFFLDASDRSSIEDVLEEMLRFARYYAAFSLGRNAPPDSALHLGRLRQLAEVAAILVMRLSDCRERAGTLSSAEFDEAIQLLESYVFRRAVCGRQSRGYWAAFAGIAYRIDEAAPLTSLKVALHRQTESYRFPSNEEFQRELQTRDLYRMRTCHYLLDSLENHNNKEPTNTQFFTVEHVLPQNENLSKAWREMLGKDWRETQAGWLHRLGNLTLTGYNSTYSDRPFEDKKQIQGGFNDSSIRLNRFIRDSDKWGSAEIERRGRLLADKAVEIWPELVVSAGAVKAEEQQELLEKANRRDASEVVMSPRARDLFDALRPQIQKLGADVVEVAESKSISYYADDFFVEVLPRKRRLVLLLNLGFAECQDLDEQAADASERAFYFYANHEGGVVYRVQDESHLEGAMRMVRQAYEMTLA